MALSHTAMAFYHSDGFVAAWKHAVEFAGEGGRIATMPDIVDARINAERNSVEWSRYFTTRSAEYFGYSAGGVRILIVAHGVGPMASLEGITKAYSHEFADKSRSNRGGRIPMSLFRRLERGLYGEVSIVEIEPLLRRYVYPFITYLTVEQACAEPLMRARMGKRAEEYFCAHGTMARKYHEEAHGIHKPDPFIVQMEQPGNCPYVVGGFDKIPREYVHLDKGDGALAHLLSVGGLSRVSHDGALTYPSLACDSSCHEWWNGVRLVGVRSNEAIAGIHPGFDNIHELICQNWVLLMQPCERASLPRLSPLMRKGNVLFTQYAKAGAGLDTHEPEYLVTSAKRINGANSFVTPILGYHALFKYDIRSVEAMAPLQANAYELVGDVENIWRDGNPEEQKVGIRFYHIEADTGQRLPREKEIKNDYQLLMSLTENT